MLAGVCGGLAEYFEVDPTLIRVGAVLLGVFTSGGVVIVYLIMAAAVPEEPVSAAPAALTSEGVVDVVESAGTPEPGSDIPRAPEVVPSPDSVSEPANAPSHAPVAPAWTPPETSEGDGGGIGFGVALIAIGGLLLANQFIPGIDIWRFWPVIIIAVGISAIFKGVRR